VTSLKKATKKRPPATKPHTHRDGARAADALLHGDLAERAAAEVGLDLLQAGL
jgi:hypothetical protein